MPHIHNTTWKVSYFSVWPTWHSAWVVVPGRTGTHSLARSTSDRLRHHATGTLAAAGCALPSLPPPPLRSVLLALPLPLFRITSLRKSLRFYIRIINSLAWQTITTCIEERNNGSCGASSTPFFWHFYPVISAILLLRVPKKIRFISISCFFFFFLFLVKERKEANESGMGGNRSANWCHHNRGKQQCCHSTCQLCLWSSWWEGQPTCCLAPTAISCCHLNLQPERSIMSTSDIKIISWTFHASHVSLSENGDVTARCILGIWGYS